MTVVRAGRCDVVPWSTEVAFGDLSSQHPTVVVATAPEHVLLTAAGAALELKGGNITLKGPGKVEFKASLKELKGPASAEQSLELKKPAKLKGCAKLLESAAQSGAAV